ncbi:hypothetical protein [Actinoplanes sp. URMC 104]|uniref:hypothetical protein n=1 Tax=Actinoplanes sp. URMC 104 TaxID=3423409 RepID=UPI003F1ADFA3
MADDPLPASTTGTGRLCRAAHRRTRGARSPLVVRHHDGALTLAARRHPPVVPTPPARGVWAVAGAAGLTLLAALVLLFLGPRVYAGAGEAGPCPRRTSLLAADGGSTLRVRPDPGRNLAGLVHLCVDPGTQPVRGWSVTATGRDGRSADATVLAVGNRLALAAVPGGGPTVLTVRADLVSGDAAIFRVRIDAR